jgi:hypothetical protein
MIATLNFAGLVLATIFAAATAVVCNWLFLRVMFNRMRPAAVGKTPESAIANQPTVHSELVRGTAELARALAPSRRAI